jgi:hypothetical protein
VYKTVSCIKKQTFFAKIVLVETLINLKWLTLGPEIGKKHFFRGPNPAENGNRRSHRSLVDSTFLSIIKKWLPSTFFDISGTCRISGEADKRAHREKVSIGEKEVFFCFSFRSKVRTR